MGYSMNANAIAIDNVRHMATQHEEPELSWLQRRMADTGVIMALTQPKLPPGFYVNWTTVTSLIVVVTAIAGLWYFTWQSARESGFAAGKIEAERQQLADRLTKAEEELRRTKDLKVLQAGQAAGHEQEKK